MDSYTFSTLVVGEFNELAFDAALAVAEHPGENYNALLIYGDYGLGKTHLLHAIHHAICERYPCRNTIFVGGDAFVAELLKAVRDGVLKDFRDKYRSVDTLLIDDIQCLGGSHDFVQREVFDIINTISANKGQIVFTADCSTEELPCQNDWMRMRYEEGALVEIKPPEYDARLSIAKKFAADIKGKTGIDIPEDILCYIAEQITGSIRVIHNAITTIVAYRDLLGI